VTSPVEAARDLHSGVHVHGKALERATRLALVHLLGALLPGRRLVSARRLTGGLWAHTQELTLVDGAGSRLRLVLRRYVRWEKGSGADQDCVRHATALRAFEGSDAPVPQLVWVDPDGDVLDVPALICTLLPGRSSLAAAGTPEGVELMGRALAGVHSQRVESPELGPRSSLGSRVRAALDSGRMAGLLRDCPMQVQVVSALDAGLDDAAQLPDVLCHNDFHAGNVLLSGHGARLRLGGIIDWDMAGWGPRGEDVGYCRADMAMAFGAGPGDDFSAAYRRHAGPVADSDLALQPWFDLLGAAPCWEEFDQWLPAYHAFGIPELTTALMRERLELFTEQALAELDS
jgi:aminoglycoside phosphotransferase (APT) family kinase protein